MSILAWIEDQKRLKLLNAPKYVNPASDSSKGLWTRCDKCGVILYIKHLKENQRVCFGCSYHLQMSSQERVENLLDKNTWRPLDETVSPCDPLEFHDQKDYTDRLQEAQERTGLQDAIQTGSGMVDGIPIALGVMDFDFMGGSMGSVVGEKITRLIEYATQEGLVLVLVSASGGARMQEGVFSLMQMAKISGALQIYQKCAHLLYISILTSPTTGGVTASFAMLGDIIFAEPKALIAFAGRRVIEQTLCEDLPEDFQTSEYMLHHGLLDLIVPRRFLRQALSESIRLYKNAPFKKAGRIPFGIQNPITFLVEEKIRRQLALGEDAIEKKYAHLWSRSPAFTQIPESHQTGLLQTEIDNNTHNSQNTEHKKNRYKISSERSFNDTKTFKEEEIIEIQKKDTVNKIDNTSSSLLSANNMNSSSLCRETREYREILTSFQTMFYLFSRQFAIPYSVDRSKALENLQKENQEENDFSNRVYSGRASVGRASVDRVSVDRASPDSTAFEQKGEQNLDDVLKKFMELSEKENVNRIQNQNVFRPGLDRPKPFLGVYSNEQSNGTKHSELANNELINASDFIEAENPNDKNTNVPLPYTDVLSSADTAELFNKQIAFSPSTYIDFLHQSIELAATESIEWRAFYIHQSISQKTGFLEDFVQSFSEYPQNKNNQQSSSQNMLFYRSICRHIK